MGPFFIHWESKSHAKLLCLNLPNCPIATVYFILTGDARAYFLSFLFLCCVLFSMLFVSTFMVARKCKLQLASSQLVKNQNNDVTIRQILENETTLNFFVNHLCTEYSMEI